MKVNDNASAACGCKGWVHARGIRECLFNADGTRKGLSDTAMSYGDPSLDHPANADRKAVAEGRFPTIQQEIDAVPDVVDGDRERDPRNESGGEADSESWTDWPPAAERGKTVTKWADPAMFTAEPVVADEGPKVYLLWMTPDPLGAIAGAAKLYKGQVVRNLAEVTDEERLDFFEQIKKTHLKAPFEFVQFHFLIEGVTRGFTHQMVRQRTATYVQESMRFAVKEDMPVGLPPSIAGTTGEWQNTYDRSRLSNAEKMRSHWDDAVLAVDEAYQNLTNAGMPAEDARGLLPTNILTRLHYRTDLRALLEHGGNRLCTQAQFEWRLVFSKIVEAIRSKSYGPKRHGQDSDAMWSNGFDRVYMADKIADMFRPICYLTGKCEFHASFDRPCSIRDRVDMNASMGRPSSEWPESSVGKGWPVNVAAIRPEEWLADPGAAR